MQQRSDVFLQFFGRYPSAERRENLHENGWFSTFAVGLIHGHVDGAFLGIYKQDGAHRSEEYFPLDVIEDNFGGINVGNAEMLARLTDLAVAKVKSPIKI